MSESYRIRTTPGYDQNIKINLNQKYETLDILSLKLRQTDLYGSNCADFGVVVGRVFTNGGYGIPNARVAIFVPITDDDEQNEIINTLYPYKNISNRNEDGYRYNLLPKRQQHSGHTPTGTFPSKLEVLSDDNVLEVFEKYYKFTAKTNDAGDFMITGVPVGTYTIHYDVDLSDIGCQSLVPFDMRYEGVSEEQFENGYTFKASDNIDSLPQIVSMNRTIDVEPLWGDNDVCNIGITRSDFDLESQGVRIEPYALFMGGTYTDTERNGVKVRCNVDNEMGEKCLLTTTEGDIESIRFTGRYEKNSDGSINVRRPILERFNLDSTIDEEGNFFVRVPMNLRYMVTNEFGYLVESRDPKVGIPTEGKYRFRFSLNDASGGRRTYRAKFLVPQIKEHQGEQADGRSRQDLSYSFSTNIDDYPETAIDDIVGSYSPKQYPNDYFYGFRYGRVYTVSGFINQYYNQGALESAFSFFSRNRNESFIGIKEIQPEVSDDCNQTNQYFPINDAVSNNKFKFIVIILLSTLERLYLNFTQFFIDVYVEAAFDLADFWRSFLFFPRRWRVRLSRRFYRHARKTQKAGVRVLGLINYPDCFDCADASGNNFAIPENVFDFEIDNEDLLNNIISSSLLISYDDQPYFVWDFGEVEFFYEEMAADRNAIISRNTSVNLNHGVNDELNEDDTFMVEYVVAIDDDGRQITNHLLIGNNTSYPIVFSDTIKRFNENENDYDKINGEGNEIDGSMFSDYVILGLIGKVQQDIINNNLEKLNVLLDNDEINSINFFDDLYSSNFYSGTTVNQIDGDEIRRIVSDELSLNGSGTYTPGGRIRFLNVWKVSNSAIVYSPNFSGDPNEVESGCEKYDMIFSPTVDMRLRALVDDGSGSDITYEKLIEDPDYYKTINNGKNPNPFEDIVDTNGNGKIDECDDLPKYNVIVTISEYVDENSDWTHDRGRRLAFAKHGAGTASGYSEFKDGVYTIVPAAGKNRDLIRNYARRKRLGSLLCSGYISYNFVNSWLNGSLYFFQFRRRNSGNAPTYCRDLIYRKEEENGEVNYYYRSTPYQDGKFIGLDKSFISFTESDAQRGQTEILYPTTIMDLGPKNNFLNEICTDSELDVNCSVTRSIGPTSYQDINDLMTYILQSKEIKELGLLEAKDLFDKRGNSEFLSARDVAIGLAIGVATGGIGTGIGGALLFNNNKPQGHIDGDIAQLLNMNSQTGIYGYEDESVSSPYWPENGEFKYDFIGPVGVNFVFSEDDPDTLIVEKNGAFVRFCINAPAQLSETSQVVPYYRWDKQGPGFGNKIGYYEKQDWVKSVIYETKYQGGWSYENMLKDPPPHINQEDYPDTPFEFYYDKGIEPPQPTYETYVLPPLRNCELDNYAMDVDGGYKIPLGGPFFFYFGLRSGKSSFDKFIKNFGPY